MKNFVLFLLFISLILFFSFRDNDFVQISTGNESTYKVLYYSLYETDNIIMDEEDLIYTMNGIFRIKEEVADLNWYTYNLFYGNKLIGRYYLGSDFKKRETEICVNSKRIKIKFSISRECINLIELDNKGLFSNIQNAIKNYPQEFYKNPEILNNKGFFLYKYKYYKEALLFFNKTIELFPNRTVAYLNIADCYWELNEKTKAITHYNKYLELLQLQNKNQMLVPKRVYERIKG